jgi:deoxyribodipyrimidine photo-lyase
MLSLFIFRRDLRLEDNTGLIAALQASEKVIPAFIFTPEQIDHNPYKSEHCLNFMLESLADLDQQLKKKGSRLYLFKGEVDEVVHKCITKLEIGAVYVNRDYTPYSIERDRKIERVCKKANIEFHSFEDALLHPPEDTLKKDGKPYTVFTPYFHNASKLEVPPPVPNRRTNYFHGSIPFTVDMPKHKTELKGGRTEALKLLKNAKSPTHLSPYLKFTVCSPREVYEAVKRNKELVRALYWRDFFTSIAFFFPHVFKGSFRPKFDQLKWSYDKKAFKRWCEGTTGFPIVDAAMRHMNQTGYMPNRFRMVTASFLVKDLHIDWRWGEKYFAQTLIDYDPAVNNGNWQWVASTGCDAQPYFRVFNPWSQQKKFDPDGTYVKEWIPEIGTPDYPEPMVDHDVESKKAIAAYREVR